MDENNIFDKYKQWRQKLLDDSEGMDSLKVALLGFFIAIGSSSISIFAVKNLYPTLYSISMGVIVVGAAIFAIGIIYGNYLVIKRSPWFKWVRNFFNK